MGEDMRASSCVREKKKQEMKKDRSILWDIKNGFRRGQP